MINWLRTKSDMGKHVKLTDEQIAAINEIEHNLQIIACAGSGKTEVITRRIAHIVKSNPGISPQNIVAFTFTEKAAASMKKRIENALSDNADFNVNDMYIGTIHAFCSNILREHIPEFKSYRILDTVKSHLFLYRYGNECGMNELELEVHFRTIMLFLQCVDKMIDDRDNSSEWTEQQRIALEKYIKCLYDHKYMDFNLMIYETLCQIRSNPEVQKYLSNIRYLIVDEYQDVDDMQEKLISRIAQHGANICVVGDDDQTIYQFRGSNANNMISFSERYSDVRQIHIDKNFRCNKGVVDVADKVISNNQNRLSKQMVSGVDTDDFEIKALRYSSKEDEFEGIAAQIVQLHSKGIPYSDMAVLFRKGKHMSRLAFALKAKGVPYECDSGDDFFEGNYFSKFVSTLSILTEIDKSRLYECWGDTIDEKSFNIGFKYLRASSVSGNMSLSEIINGFCEKIGFLNPTVSDVEERQIAFDGFMKILGDYNEIYADWQLSARISGLLYYLEKHAQEEYKYYNFNPQRPDDAVHIMTIHKSKGLEFHTVFLAELMEREFPVGGMGGRRYWHVLGGVFEQNKDKYSSDLEDERKLFYVAITRAKVNLYLTYELSKKPVSTFVVESSKSDYLYIDKNDLSYIPVVSKKSRLEKMGLSPEEIEARKKEEEEEREEREREREEKKEYWNGVKKAKKALRDYYGTGSYVIPALRAAMASVYDMDPDEAISEASRLGLI